MSRWDAFLKRHANVSEQALAHPLVKGVVKEQFGNITGNHGTEPDGLVAYGLWKIAAYTAQVARAQALGIDPDVLRLDARQATDAQMELMAQALAADKEVVVVVDEIRGERT